MDDLTDVVETTVILRMTIKEVIEMTIDAMKDGTTGDVVEMTVKTMVVDEMIMKDVIGEMTVTDVRNIEIIETTVPGIEVLGQSLKRKTPKKKGLQHPRANLAPVAAHPPPLQPHPGHPLDNLNIAVLVPAALHLHPLVIGPDHLLANVEMKNLLLPLGLEMLTVTSLSIVPRKPSLQGRNLRLLVDRGEIVLDVRIDEGHPGGHLLPHPAEVVLAAQFVRETKSLLKKRSR